MIKKLLLILLIPTYCYSAPSISTAPGTYEDGNEIVITGTGFGTNDLDIEWLGGASGNIESGTPTNDFAKTNWSIITAGVGAVNPEYSTTRKHSHSQSVLFEYAGSQTTSIIMWDTSSQVTEWYFTFWVHADKDDGKTGGQWKPWRISDAGQYNVGGTASALITDHWFSNTNDWGNNGYQNFYDDGAENDVQGQLPTDGYDWDEWFRLEIYCKAATGNDQADGLWTATRVGYGSDFLDQSDIITTVSGSGDVPWRYLLFGCYYGNLSGPTTRDLKEYIDDIYISHTKARVEIGDNVTYNSVTSREVQISSAWSDTEVTFNVNEGGYSGSLAGKYLFVIDSAGDASSGFLISDSVTPGTVTLGAGQPVTLGEGTAVNIQ